MEHKSNFMKIKANDELIINLSLLQTVHVGTSAANGGAHGLNLVFEKNTRFIPFPDRASALKTFNLIWEVCQTLSGGTELE